MEYTSLLVFLIELSNSYDGLLTAPRLFDVLFNKEATGSVLSGRRKGPIISRSCWKVISKITRLSLNSPEQLLRLGKCKQKLEFGLQISAGSRITQDAGFSLMLEVKNKRSKTSLLIKDCCKELEQLHPALLQSIKRVGAELETYFENRNMPTNMFHDRDVAMSTVLELISKEQYDKLKDEALSEPTGHFFETKVSPSTKEKDNLNAKAARELFLFNVDETGYDSDEESTDEDYEHYYETTDVGCILLSNNIAKSSSSSSTLLVNKSDNESLITERYNELSSYIRKRVRTFIEVEDLIDQYLISLTVVVVILNLSEMLELRPKFSQYAVELAKLASHFIKTCMPLLERVLGFENKLLKKNITNLTFRDLGSREGVNEIFYKIIYKLRLLDGMFSSMDLFLFPKTIRAHQRGVKSISFSHIDPLIILTSGYDRLIKIWDLRTGQILGVFAGHRSIVPWCTFSSDDNFIVSCSFDATLKVWESKSGRCICTLSGHEDIVLSGDLSKDDKLILSASMDSTVRLWNAQTGDCFRVFRGHAPNSWVKCVRFLPGDLTFVSGGLDRHLVFWSVVPQKKNAGKKESVKNIENIWTESEHQPIQVYDEHTDYILDLDITTSNKSAYLITTSKDCTQKLFDLSTYGLSKDFKMAQSVKKRMSIVDETAAKTEHRIWSSSVSFSPDGMYFVTASYDNSLVVTATVSGKVIRRIRVYNKGIHKVIFTPDGKSLLLGTSSGSIQVISL